MNATAIAGGGLAADMRTIEILPDKIAAATRAAELLYEISQASSEAIAVALAGGSTPKLLYRMMAAEPWFDLLPWSRMKWFFGDERFVPSDDPESNFRMARENLFEPAGVSIDSIFRVRTELAHAEAAAMDYDNRIRDAVACDDQSIPQFDFVLLGMGDDGHTASLFPDTAALAERDAAVVANYVEKLSAWRVTLTVPVLLAAQKVVMLVTGSEKAEALAAVLEGELNENFYPSQVLNRRTGETIWLVDAAAASKLKSQ